MGKSNFENWGITKEDTNDDKVAYIIGKFIGSILVYFLEAVILWGMYALDRLAFPILPYVSYWTFLLGTWNLALVVICIKNLVTIHDKKD